MEGRVGKGPPNLRTVSHHVRDGHVDTGSGGSLSLSCSHSACRRPGWPGSDQKWRFAAQSCCGTSQRC
eukprot:5009987-Prymnesium_polylepis.1